MNVIKICTSDTIYNYILGMLEVHKTTIYDFMSYVVNKRYGIIPIFSKSDIATCRSYDDELEIEVPIHNRFKNTSNVKLLIYPMSKLDEFIEHIKNRRRKEDICYDTSYDNS